MLKRSRTKDSARQGTDALARRVVFLDRWPCYGALIDSTAHATNGGPHI